MNLFPKSNQLQYVKQGGGLRASHLMTMQAGNSNSDADETQFPVLRVLLKHNFDSDPDC